MSIAVRWQPSIRLWPAVRLLSFAGILTLGCKPPAPPAKALESTSEVISPEMQAYQKSVADYNDFLAHPKHHRWNVEPHDRQIELCYLSAQILATSVRVPALAADTNDNGEIKEWRHWIDIRHNELRCDDVR